MERLKRLRDKANALPLLPGVYIMRNKEGKIIYDEKGINKNTEDVLYGVLMKSINNN